MAVHNQSTIEDAMRSLDGRLGQLMPKLMERMGQRMRPTDLPRRTVDQQWEDFRTMTSGDMTRLVDTRGEAAVKQYILQMLQVFAYRQTQEITHGR